MRSVKGPNRLELVYHIGGILIRLKKRDIPSEFLTPRYSIVPCMCLVCKLYRTANKLKTQKEKLGRYMEQVLLLEEEISKVCL